MAGSYICDPGSCPGTRPRDGGGVPFEDRHCYHESTRRRLEWQYGENRVNADDIAAWNSLGQRREIAA